MKSVKLACLAAAVLALTGASVWEGAAAAAPGGQLPNAGFFAATNSFPRNTVVDITNLENGKSIRVIVAAGLDAPGLLAVLSGNAAELIGLRSGSIGRIRMTQPEDPIAFSRFTEGMGAYGEPDYSSGIPVTDEPAYAPSPYPAPAPFFGAKGPETSSSGAATAADGLVPNAAAGSAPPAYAPEPEWEDFSYGKVVDLPGEAASPGESGWIAPPAIAEAEPESPAGNSTGKPAENPTGSEKYEYSLVPAEERPPEDPSLDLISPEDIIPGISAPGADEDYTSFMADLPPEEPPVLAEEPEPFIPEDEPVLAMDHIPAEAPETGAEADYSPPPFPFISRLEWGKYYVQIGAFNRPELIETAVNRIGANYPLAVQNAGSEREPVYRVLLGPLNLGESGAMLQRVKSIGYKDAFVRNVN